MKKWKCGGKLINLGVVHTQKELKGFLRVAMKACRAAGRVQMKAFGGVQQVEHKGEIDLVTAIDRLSEERILGILTEAFPCHDCLAEERPPSGRGSEYLWVVDPLDGTTNYSRGFPVFAVSIALTWRREPIVGAVYSPVLDELFTALSGGGAFLNGSPIAVSAEARLDSAFLATGFPYDIRRSKRNNLDNFTRFATRCLALRRAGAAALDLAYVAAGRFDGFWELKLKPWDTAAGMLLVAEAGGKVTSPSGRAFRLGSRDIIASNGIIHRQMIDVLRRKRARGAVTTGKGGS
jgi:myo-inositol-1(or 4)-monophosphatase